MVVDRSNYPFFWIVITRGICWYGSRQHRSNFWIKSLYKLSCDPQISCTGCDPAAIWNTDPWTHTNIMKLHRLRNRGLGGLSPSIFWVVVVLRSPIHANEPSEYNGMLYRTSNRVLNNGIKVIILICMDGTSQYHHYHILSGGAGVSFSPPPILYPYKKLD